MGKRRANRLLNERPRPPTKKSGTPALGRRCRGVERFEIREQRELIQTRKERSVRIACIDRWIDGARERIAGQARQRVAADHVDLRLGLVLEKGLIDLVLRALDVEGSELWPPGQRQRQRLIERVWWRRAIREVSRHERLIPHPRGPVRQHQPLQPVLRLGQRLLSGENRLLKPRDLRLRLDDIDWRQRSLRHLPLVARDLPARLCEGIRQDDEVTGGKGEIPIRLLDERQLVHHDLGELRVGEVHRAAGDEDVATIQVDGSAAHERLHVGAGQRRWKLRVEPRELVAGIEARAAEVHRVASTRPR